MRSCFGFERLKRFMFLSSGRFNQIVRNKSVSGRIVMVEEIFRMAAPDFLTVFARCLTELEENQMFRGLERLELHR